MTVAAARTLKYILSHIIAQKWYFCQEFTEQFIVYKLRLCKRLSIGNAGDMLLFEIQTATRKQLKFILYRSICVVHAWCISSIFLRLPPKLSLCVCPALHPSRSSIYSRIERLLL